MLKVTLDGTEVSNSVTVLAGTANEPGLTETAMSVPEVSPDWITPPGGSTW